MLKKLLALANKLDQQGFYKEADVLDKIAIKYPHDFNPPAVEPPEEWEMELMNMEISPEAIEKEQDYKKHMVPTDPSEVEEMASKQQDSGIDTGAHIMLRMQNALKKLEGKLDAEDDNA